MDLIFKIASTTDEISAAKKIRKEVFVKEQGFPKELDADSNDDCSIHLLALDSQKQIIGTGRLTIAPDNKSGVLSRISVIASFRNKGAGKQIVSELELIAKQNSLNKVTLMPHFYLQRFYEALGYQNDNNDKLVAGYRLLSMSKQL